MYTVIGYGIDISKMDSEKFKYKDFIESIGKIDGMENISECFHECLKENYERDPSDLADEWIYFYENDKNQRGLSALMADAMSFAEKADIRSFDCGIGCVFVPEKLPWDISEKEFTMKKEDWEEIFRKWFRLLTDEEIVFERMQMSIN